MKKELPEKSFGWVRSDSKDQLPLTIKEFNQEFFLVNPKGEVTDVSPEGSLGLLALGSLGYHAWTKARDFDKEKNGQ